MSESYTKAESDLRFEQLLGEVRQGFSQVREGFLEMEGKFALVEKDITWIKTVLTAGMMGLFLTLIGVIVPIAWTLWANIAH